MVVIHQDGDRHICVTPLNALIRKLIDGLRSPAPEVRAEELRISQEKVE